MSSSFRTLAVALMLGAAAQAMAQPANMPPPGGEAPISFNVHEGTSMAVSASPDGKWLAMDLQGSLWIIPAAGGKAKRITDYFNDARQPVWAPDGSRLVYFGYRDGGYDLWSIRPDGSEMKKLTEGAYDDREPVFSPDGNTLAFSSDRSGNYDIWTMDVATGAMKQISSNGREDRLPTWSPDGARIAYSGVEGSKTAIYVTDLASGRESVLKQGDGRVDAPSFGPTGELAYVIQDGAGSHLMIGDTMVSGTENVFPFRLSWLKGGYYYVSDGKIRHGGARRSTVDFAATLEVVRPHYMRAKRDWDSTAPRKALGITHPRLSPDGGRIAFVALGDLYVVSSKGGTPENLTKDSALDADADWSPDGKSIVFSSDRVGGLPQLFIKDLATGKDRQLTAMDTQPLGAAWSPDGRQIAFIDVDGRWGVAGVCVVDVATGKVTRLQTSLGQPGTPSWSADGKYVAISLSYKFSNSFREGTNQVYVIPVDGKSEPFWQIPQANMSLDTRSGSGPVWSPDGTKMAGIYEGLLKLWPIDKDGKALGPVRSFTSETAFFPTWSADSGAILYQSDDRLRKVDIATGVVTDVPINLTYRLAKPTGRTVIHVGKLIDSVRDETQLDKDIVIDGNRIAAIRDHDAGVRDPSATYIDASGLTAIPGLIEYHSHIQKDFGSNLEKAWLAYGITTVRDPGTQVYDAVEDREAAEAGIRISPRLYTGGPLLEWQRVYYKMGIAVSSPAHLERELARARALKYDIVKSYVRMPDIYQRRIVEAAHDMGIPVSGHEIFPAAFTGVDGTEHMGATSRRGYSPKQGPGGMAYEDVIALFSKSQRTLTPTLFGALGGYLTRNPGYAVDPRVRLYPKWAQETVTGNDPMAALIRPMMAGSLASLKQMYDGGAHIVAGTDTMIATNLHAEIAAYVDAGLTPFQALQTATVNAAKALNLDAGTLEAGKLADIVLIDGDPRENIANTFKVKTVIANGNAYTVDDLLKGVTK
ncbi:Tol biopolymer transport system component [Sphingobium fontiphilum]|uniref:Tol biopolymer transport system component n=2 Tax=Sphingobium fontiphilum TaxID=944425 RepID=A0A7W6GPB2_9SPHN|nr:Tol biopolymer transport system component [Sphingobium fontiphilum]